MTTTSAANVEVLGRGKFLQLVRRDGWEFVQRTKPVRAAFIGAVTPEGRFLLTEEYRVPVATRVIGCPAGLVGDHEGGEAEELTAAANRELREEAGYEAGDVQLLTAGPTSPGQSDEVIAVVLARNLRKVGPGGGVGGERIVLREVPLDEVDAWLQEREREGRLIDPKVYTVLYFVRCRG